MLVWSSLVEAQSISGLFFYRRAAVWLSVITW